MTQNEQNIDKIIKEKFEDFQASPPNHVWRNIKGSVAGGSSLFLLYKFLGTPLGAGISVVTGITLAVLGYNVLTTDKDKLPDITERRTDKTLEEPISREINPDNETPDDKTSDAFMVKDDDENEIISEVPSKEIKSDEKIAPGSEGKQILQQVNSIDNNQIVDNTGIETITDENKSIQSDRENVITPGKKSLRKGKIKIEQDASAGKSEQYLDETENIFLANEIAISQLKMIDQIIIGNIPFRELFYSPSTLTKTSVSDSALFADIFPSIQIKDDYGKRSNLALGIFYAREKVYYPLRSDQISNTIDINGIYSFSDFLIQSGLGITTVKDLCDYNVNYNSFEIVGSYYEVDSLIFDSITGNPTYYTTLQNVYDSVNGDCSSNAINKYTYLRIPLIFGYKKEFKRWSYFIKGGPVLNILVKNTEPEPHSFASDMAIQHIDRLTPGRIKTYWQLYMGVGLSYQVNRWLGIMIEPTASYNLSSIYNRNYLTSKRPYSMGLRSGIIFNF